MVSGEDCDYKKKTDVLDVTRLFPKHMKNNQNMKELNQANSEIYKILDTQFPAKPMQLSPKKLKKIKNDLS